MTQHMEATLRGEKGKISVWDPRPGKGLVGTFDAVKETAEAIALHTRINAEIKAEAEAADAEKAGKPQIKVSKGKATIVNVDRLRVGYKGMSFGGYQADWEFLFQFFGVPADAPIRAEYEAFKSKLCTTWTAAADLKAGQAYPSGEVKAE